MHEPGSLLTAVDISTLHALAMFGEGSFSTGDDLAQGRDLHADVGQRAPDGPGDLHRLGTVAAADTRGG
jgi:hypothetical protein